MTVGKLRQEGFQRRLLGKMLSIQLQFLRRTASSAHKINKCLFYNVAEGDPIRRGPDMKTNFHV